MKTKKIKFIFLKAVWRCAVIFIAVVCIINFKADKNSKKEYSGGIVNKTNITKEADLINSVEFETEKSKEKESLTDLNDLEQLKKRYYIVTSATEMTADLFNAEEFENTDLKINNSGSGAKILVFHTHSTERFADSTADIEDGIVGAGERLCDILESKYNIKCLHIKDSFDVVDGKTKIMGAYERMEPVIRQALNENPSIEMVIDMHRDGVAENVRLVTEINGKQTAQIMFFNGLCLLKQNGKTAPTEGLSNPYLKTNLALSYNLKKNADALYPGFAKKIYLNAYRYSLHMLPKSTLIEVGAQTNTKEEIYNAVDLLAEVIAKTIF